MSSCVECEFAFPSLKDRSICLYWSDHKRDLQNQLYYSDTTPHKNINIMNGFVVVSTDDWCSNFKEKDG